MKTMIFALAFVAIMNGAARAQGTAYDEKQLGDQVFQRLKQQHEIVVSSPLYDTLRPIASSLTRVIQPQYPYPIHFYIVHEKQPNAFAAPGGNVYVVDSLFYFVRNTEELAGTICHEMSHLVHHDSVHKLANDQAIKRREIIATLLLGGTLRTAAFAQIIGKLDSLHFSRGEEEAADVMGPILALRRATTHGDWSGFSTISPIPIFRRRLKFFRIIRAISTACLRWSSTSLKILQSSAGSAPTQKPLSR